MTTFLIPFENEAAVMLSDDGYLIPPEGRSPLYFLVHAVDHRGWWAGQTCETLGRKWPSIAQSYQDYYTGRWLTLGNALPSFDEEDMAVVVIHLVIADAPPTVEHARPFCRWYLSQSVKHLPRLLKRAPSAPVFLLKESFEDYGIKWETAQKIIQETLPDNSMVVARL